MTKGKFIALIIFIGVLFITKWILFDYNLSEGRVIGNLTNMQEKKVYGVLNSWEGSIDEGSGDKLTTYFSVKDTKLAKELYAYEGKQVILYYEEHLVTFPSRSKIIVNKWEPKEGRVKSPMTSSIGDSSALSLLSKTLFCSLLGSIRKESDLYERVKSYIKKDNLYLYNQFSKCNH